MAALPGDLARFDRIERHRLAILDRVRPLDDEALNRNPPTGGWSVGQVIAHVTVAESKSLGYIRHKLENRSGIDKAGLGASVRSLLLSISLRSPLRFKAPASAAVVPERLSFAELEREWNAIRAGWRSLLDELPADATRLAIYRHPIAGRINIAQTLRFLGDHVAHHERQIERILRANREASNARGPEEPRTRGSA